MTTLERIGLEILGGLAAIAAVILWWNLHNRAEQKIGATACIQTTTIDKTTAAAGAVKDEAAGAADINAVIRGYDAKVTSLSAANDDLARRLSDSGAICPGPVRDSRSAAGAKPADAGLPGGKGEAAAGSAELIRADLAAVLTACDANQVKTEDEAALYNGVRDRAIAAAATVKP
jgi:hypothetical protein